MVTTRFQLQQLKSSVQNQAFFTRVYYDYINKLYINRYTILEVIFVAKAILFYFFLSSLL